MPGWSGSGTAGRGCGEGVVRSTRTAISPRVLTGASPQEGQCGSQGAPGKGFSSGSTPAAGGGGRSWYVADLGYPGFTYLMRRSRELDCQTRESPSREGSAARLRTTRIDATLYLSPGVLHTHPRGSYPLSLGMMEMRNLNMDVTTLFQDRVVI